MKVPDDMTDEDVIALTDAFPTGYQAAEMCDLRAARRWSSSAPGPSGSSR